jgi:hypothetical protein
MTTDALDPGPEGDYPYWPRNPDGTTDRTRMPAGPRKHRRSDGVAIYIDPAPGNPDGTYAGPADQ